MHDTRSTEASSRDAGPRVPLWAILASILALQALVVGIGVHLLS